MGKVVQFDGPDGERSGSSRGRKRRGRGDKTALVLGGGGFTGGVYEMGALRAFDLLAVNRTVNDFDIYVGTSAGAFVASMVANGVTPEEMFRVLDKALPSPIENASLRTLLRPNYKGFRQSAGPAAVASSGHGPPAGGEHRRDLHGRHRHGPGRGPSDRDLPQPRDRGVHPHRALGPRPHQRLPGARRRAPDHRDGPRHLRADRLRRGRVGQRADLPRRCRLRGAADRLRAIRSAVASSSTAGSSRRPTSTSPWRPAPSSSSSSIRWSRT